MANHPMHPATAHFPITFTVLTGVLDALYLASITPSTANAVESAFQTLDIALPTTLLPTLSYYTTILTLLTTLPALLTGILSLRPLLLRSGLSTAKARTGVLHGLTMDVATLGAVYNWWVRRTVEGFVPSTTNVVVSAGLAVPATLGSAWLGALLVYRFGMGVGRGSGGGKANGMAKKVE